MMSERALGSLGIAPAGQEEVERRDQYGSSRPLAGSRRSQEAVMLDRWRVVFVRTERIDKSSILLSFGESVGLIGRVEPHDMLPGPRRAPARRERGLKSPRSWLTLTHAALAPMER